jgi:hypothetical protein
MKIFGIGLSRTGTTTLNYVLNQWGFNTIHYPNQNELWSNHNDGATDIPVIPVYKELDKKFTNSKFIYTIRDKEEWLNSIVPYLERKRNWTAMNNSSQVITRKKVFGTDFPSRFEAEIAWDKHEKDVKNYFTNRDNLCIINIVNGDSPKKLADFLGVNTSMKEFPNLNQLKKK